MAGTRPLTEYDCSRCPHGCGREDGCRPPMTMHTPVALAPSTSRESHRVQVGCWAIRAA